MTRKRYVQDPATGKLIPREQYRRARAAVTMIMPDIEEFISPVTGRPVGSRSTLREHNLEHDVAQHGEYGENNGEAYFKRQFDERIRRMAGQTPQDRRERLEAITRAVIANED